MVGKGIQCSNLNYAMIHTEIDRNTSQTTRENEKKYQKQFRYCKNS